MPENPHPSSGPGAEEPPCPAPLPRSEPGGAEQGLFMCLPAENMELSRFAGDGQQPAMPPGPLLAGIAAAVAGCDGTGLAEASEDFLFAVISGGRRMASWGTWLEFSAMRELALRHPATPPRTASPASPAGSGTPPAPSGPHKPAGTATEPAAGPDGREEAAEIPPGDGRVQFGEFVPDEVAMELRMTWLAAADRVSYACGLAGRLPVTFAAMGRGLLDPVRAKIIYEQTDYLSAADAAKADPILAAAAQDKTYAELRAHAARLVLKLDPESAQRRKQARRRHAHVRAFREESGNAGISAREMPSDEVLASMQNIDQRARDLRAAGIGGTLEDLRVRASLDLLQERDIRDTLRHPGQDHGPAGTGGGGGSSGGSGPGGGRSRGPGGHGGPDGNPAPGSAPARRGTGPTGPSLAALVNITIPLATVLGESGTPGEAAGFGLLDPASARDLITAAARHPRTRWCITALHPDGTAAAHACATGQHPPPPGPEPPGPIPPGPPSPGPPGPKPPWPPPPGPEPPSPESSDSRTPGTASRVQDYLRGLGVQLSPVARDSCDHRHAESGYKPSRRLQHLIRTRSTRCSAPGCGRPAARCDLDHTVAWHLGGLTCECDLAPLCKR